MDKVFRQLNKIFLLGAFIVLNFFFFAGNVSASATPVFSLSGSTSASVGQNISLEVIVTTSDNINAVDLTADIRSLTYLSSTPASGLTPVAGPSMAGTIYSITVTSLGQSKTGSVSLVTLNLKTPTSAVTATITLSGKYGIANGSGTLVTIPTKVFNVVVTKPSTITPTPTVTATTDPTATPTPTPVNTNNQVVITTSNPFVNSWTPKTTADFSWQTTTNFSGYSYVLNQSASFDVPKTVNTTTTTSYTNPDLSITPTPTGPITTENLILYSTVGIITAGVLGVGGYLISSGAIKLGGAKVVASVGVGVGKESFEIILYATSSDKLLTFITIFPSATV